MSDPAGTLAAIRASWWLDTYPEGLIVDERGAPLGVLTVSAPSCERLHLLAEEPETSRAVTWVGSKSVPERPSAMETATIERTRQRDVWRLTSAAPAGWSVSGILPITAPLPAPWAMLAVAVAIRGEAIAGLLLRLLPVGEAVN